MSRTTRLYIATVVSLGVALLAGTAIVSPSLANPSRFLQCLVLATMASTFKIRLPRMQSSVSLNFVLFIIGIASLSLFETLLMAAVSTTVQTVWRARTRPKVVQVAFNVAALLISLFTAFALTAELRSGSAKVPGLVIAGMILFLVNSWLISLVLSLVYCDSPLTIWRSCHRWVFPYYVAGAVLAVVVSACAPVCGWGAALAMLPVTYLVYAYYESYVYSVSDQPA